MYDETAFPLQNLLPCSEKLKSYYKSNQALLTFAFHSGERVQYATGVKQNENRDLVIAKNAHRVTPLHVLLKQFSDASNFAAKYLSCALLKVTKGPVIYTLIFINFLKNPPINDIWHVFPR